MAHTQEEMDMIDDGYDEWLLSNDDNLRDEYIEMNQQDYNEWCLKSNYELDCPDAVDAYIEVHCDEFDAYVSEQWNDYLRAGGDEL